MDTVNLLTALFLPWFVGGLAVKLVADRFGCGHYGFPLWAGYGFLLGQVGVAALLTLQDALGLGISYIPTVLLLFLVAVVLLWVFFAQKRGRVSADPPGRRSPPVMSVRERWLVWAIAFLLLAHVLPSLAEILWRPLFPWDAWSTWGGRAKVWFAHRELVPFVSGDVWLANPHALFYSIKAYAYPTLVSLSQTWVALALGYWSDTLINPPWLLCAIAIGLILFGHARAVGLPASMALLLCYLLFSVPIVHTHISLAGYADLWQAAYTSAALSALFVGWTKRDRFLILLGCGTAFAGVWIKQEGLVWLLVFVVIGLLLQVRWRGWLVGSVLAALGAAIWYLNGSLLVDLPLLGKLGVMGGELHLPGIGSVALAYHDIWRALLGNLFQYGSWNLFWYLFVLSLPLLLLPPMRRMAPDGESGTIPPDKPGVVMLFLLLPLGAILFIFTFSAEGAWARDFTAVNRLFIHYVPSWVLVIGVVIWSRFFGGSETQP